MLRFGHETMQIHWELKALRCGMRFCKQWRRVTAATHLLNVQQWKETSKGTVSSMYCIFRNRVIILLWTKFVSHINTLLQPRGVTILLLSALTGRQPVFI